VSIAYPSAYLVEATVLRAYAEAAANGILARLAEHFSALLHPKPAPTRVGPTDADEEVGGGSDGSSSGGGGGGGGVGLGLLASLPPRVARLHAGSLEEKVAAAALAAQVRPM